MKQVPHFYTLTKLTPALRNSHVDESRAILLNGGAGEGASHEAARALSSNEADDIAEESVSESGDATDPENDGRGSPALVPTALPNGVDAVTAKDFDIKMGDAARSSVPGEDDEEGETTEPSFGDLLATKFTKPVSIAEAFPVAKSGALIPTEVSNSMTIPSGISLSAILTQALRTNDNNLLESCFHNTDTQIIRSTIQRIDSSLAGTLIQKLAERLSSRPGRYGHLLVWVQWICVAHGAAVGGQPDALNKVKILYKVLSQRSKALDSLLLLKGKLDMLDAQLGLRKQLLADRGSVGNPQEGHVIYIEGEENSSSSDDDALERQTSAVTTTNGEKKEKKNLHVLVGEESSDDEDMPMTNGVVAEFAESNFDSEDDEEGPILQQEGGLVDDEAEESDEDSHPSDREDDVSQEEEPADSDEEDSEMDDFIDDGPIEQGTSGSEISIDETQEKPAAKRHRQH